jgi:hypothetical protein
MAHSKLSTPLRPDASGVTLNVCFPRSDSGEDATWRCDPHEGFGIGVSLSDEAVDGDLKFGDGSEHATFEGAVW